MRQEKYRKGVFIVVYRKTKNLLGKQKTKYLVLKRHLHWTGWEFPKGGLETKESEKKAVERELFEETGQKGFDFKKYRYNGKYKYQEKLPDRKQFIGQTYILYSAEIKEKKIVFDKREHSKYKWVSFEKAQKLLTWKNQKKGLEIVNKSLQTKYL